MSAARRAEQRPRARAVAAPRPLREAPAKGTSRRAASLLPSSRSLLVGGALLALAVGAYAGARATSLFAVRSVEVSGAPPAVAAQVRHALAPLLGTSLVGLDGSGLERRVEALPTVVSATYDRAFPNALRVAVVPERPAAVVRAGLRAWLVSARARVVGRVGLHDHPELARIWLPSRASLVAGSSLTLAQGSRVAEALAAAGRFPAHVDTASLVRGSLVFRLRSGLELRLGDPNDVRLKLAVARRALPLLPPGTTYLDVSLPGRAVAGAESSAPENSQLSTGG